MELRRFEKPYGTLLNSANWATGGPLMIKSGMPREGNPRYKMARNSGTLCWCDDPSVSQSKSEVEPSPQRQSDKGSFGWVTLQGRSRYSDTKAGIVATLILGRLAASFLYLVTGG